MKKLLAAITALVVLGIAGTSQQAFAQSLQETGPHAITHQSDAIWLSVRLTNLTTTGSGLWYEEIPMPSGYGNQGTKGYADFLNLISALESEGGGHGFLPKSLEPPYDHFWVQVDRNTTWILSSNFSQWAITIAGDGSVSPTDGIWNIPHPGGNTAMDSSTVHVQVESLVGRFSDNNNTTSDASLDAIEAKLDALPAGPPGPAGATGDDGAAGGQGVQGKIGADGDDAPCVDCQDVANAAFDLACKIMAFHPPSSVDVFKACVQTIAGIAIVGSNICPDSLQGQASCAELIDSQAQAVLDSK